MDIDNIAPGLNFLRVIEEWVDQCDALLAIIGPRWLDATDEHGAAGLMYLRDFVRIEIETALRQDKRVISGAHGRRSHTAPGGTSRTRSTVSWANRRPADPRTLSGRGVGPCCSSPARAVGQVEAVRRDRAEKARRAQAEEVAARPEFHVRRGGAMKMSVLYHNDVDAERCRISLCEKSPVALFTLGSKNRVVWLSGVVHRSSALSAGNGASKWT